MKNNPNATRYTSITLVVLGLVMIYFGWNGAAGPENGVDLRAQFPYLISGGLGGIALIAAGLTLVRTFESRRDSQRLEIQVARLTAVVERLEAALYASGTILPVVNGQPLVEEHHVIAQPDPAPVAAGVPYAPPPPAPPFEPASN